MSHDTSLAVEAVDALVLHRTPGDAIVTLTNRRHIGADVLLLLREAPRRKLCLTIRHEEKSLLLASHPDIALAVFEQGPNLGRIHIEAWGRGGIALQTIGARWYPEQSVAKGAYIDIAMAVGNSNTITAHGLGLSQVERRINRLPVLIDEEPVTTDDHRLSLPVEESRWHTIGRRRHLHLLAYRPVAETVGTTLPESALRILIDAIEEHIARIALIFLKARQHGDLRMNLIDPIARCSNHQASVVQLHYRRGTWLQTIREMVVDETVGDRVIALQSLGSTHPESSLLVA